MTEIKAWAVVVEGTNDIPYTNTHPILGEGTIYQIYTNLVDAEAFLRIRFSDARYKVKPCNINL